MWQAEGRSLSKPQQVKAEGVPQLLAELTAVMPALGHLTVLGCLCKEVLGAGVAADVLKSAMKAAEVMTAGLPGVASEEGSVPASISAAVAAVHGAAFQGEMGRG